MYKNILIVLVFNLLGKGIVLIRETKVAGMFGANATTDAYNIATQLNSMIGDVFAEAITACFIPVLGKLYGKDNQSKNNLKYINRLSSMMILLVASVSFGVFLIAEIGRANVVKILAPGFEEERFIYSVNFVKITLIVVLVIPLICIFNGILSLNEQFVNTSIASLILNLPPVVYLIFRKDIYGFIYCFVAGYIIQALYLWLCVMKTGFRFEFYFNINDANFRKFLTLLGPVLLSFGITEVNTLIDRMMASTLDSGQLSLYSYALKLENMIHVILSTCFITVLFSVIARLDPESNQFRDTISETTTNMLYVLAPIMIIAICLSEHIISFVFERNSFTVYDRSVSSGIFMILGVGITMFPFRDLLNRICYATNDTKTPIKCSFISVLVNVVGNIVLVKVLGVYGLAVATVMASIISVALLVYYLRRNNIRIFKKDNFADLIKIAVCSSITWVAIMLLKTKVNYFDLNFAMKFLYLAVLTGAALMIYAIFSIILKVNVILQIKEYVWDMTNNMGKQRRK